MKIRVATTNCYLPLGGQCIGYAGSVPVCLCVWVLRCHSREAHGRQHTSLTTDYACNQVRTYMEGNVPGTVCYRCATSIVLLVPLCCVC